MGHSVTQSPQEEHNSSPTPYASWTQPTSPQKRSQPSGRLPGASPPACSQELCPAPPALTLSSHPLLSLTGTQTSFPESRSEPAGPSGASGDPWASTSVGRGDQASWAGSALLAGLQAGVSAGAGRDTKGLALKGAGPCSILVGQGEGYREEVDGWDPEGWDPPPPGAGLEQHWGWGCWCEREAAKGTGSDTGISKICSFST